ncbi:RHS repeat-associated core domain-containing protein [Geodermatophilus sp. DSM 45219]|uniref:RHS repeat-associated core domain-containing protein n=1 Tax=Geodermatophilus sp. DSM 45219 TaxID=1881103 RepID=UPI000882FDFD|nr:RHS repeat-associated core domain-containing protein [Geodermatophilus sp. DSM 45219]SDO21088.1 RHS repeat-associated core domain-containing protein [Geodermatophilus sp. DSM 45219]
MPVRPASVVLPTWRAKPLGVLLAATLTIGVAGAPPASAAPDAPAPAGAGEDRGPGPQGPKGTPYPRDEDRWAAAAAQRQAGPGKTDPVEVPGLRTRTSRTVQDPVSGVLSTQLSTGSLNFQNADGEWVPVDNDLVATGRDADGGWANAANRFTATFPATLAAGAVQVVDVADPQRRVSLELAEDRTAPAAGAGKVDGAEVVYPDAVGAGVDVTYEAQADGVKESIVLDSSAAVASLGADGAVSFELAAGRGLHAVETDDVVTVVDADDRAVFVIPAPFMDDAAGAHSDDVTVDLAEAGRGRWRLTLTPDRAWLADPARAFPVVVDPTIEYPSPMLGCSIRSAAATTAACAGSALPVSWNSTDGTAERALLRFDELLTVVPADNQVQRAHLNLHVTATTGAVASSVDVREVTAAWTNAATWNTRNGTTAWTTPGGDRAPQAAGRATLTPNGTYQNIEVGELVSRWVEGTAAHHGFSLEKTTAASGGQRLQLSAPTSTAAPSLYVDWQPRTGARKADSAAVQLDLTDRTSVSVNPANGNAAVSTGEFSLSGVGLDLQIGHTSNSLATDFLGPLGHGWTTSTGGAGGVRLTVQPWAVSYRDGSGALHVFHRALDGSYTRPMGLDADLATGPNGTWTLTARSSKVVQTFTGIGGATYGLSKVTDRNGNALTFTYDAAATLPYSDTRILRSITDTRGRTVAVTNPGYWNTAATDWANRSVFYETNANNELALFTDAAGGHVRYGYDAAHRVTSITTPEGKRTTLAYDDRGRITRLTRVTDTAAGTGPTWTFSYGTTDRSTGTPATRTEVRDPNDNTTTYTSDGRGRVGRVTDARGKHRDATYTPNDDTATTTFATPAAGGGAATTTSTYNPETFTLANTRTPTGAGMAHTYGTGARLYDPISSTDARGNTTGYTYNTRGETSAVTQGGTTVRYLYQGDTDPAYGGTVNCGPTVNGAVTATKTGVLCEERDALYTAGTSAATTTAHRTAYRYDNLGQLTTLIPPGTDAAGQTTTGRGIQTFTYDTLSRLETLTDGKGQKTVYGYDALNRRTYVQHHDKSSESSYITGDGPLRELTEYDPAGTRTRATQYNRHPQLVDRIEGIRSPEGPIEFDYDSLGRMTSYADAGGQVRYTYNPANQLTAITEPGGDCTSQTYATPGAASTKCILFAVDDDGRRTAVRYPGEATQTWTLDGSGRPTQIKGVAAGATRLDLTLSWADATLPASASNPGKDTGLVTSVTDAVTARKTTHTYDALDRLTVANTTPSSGGTTTDYEAFCYDPAGNRTAYYTLPGATCTSASPAIAATYDGANQMTSATGLGSTGTLTGTGFTYDGNGNQTTAKANPGRTVTYNDRNQAVTTTPAGGAAVTSRYAGTGNLERVAAGNTTFQPSPLSPAPAWSATEGTSTWTLRDPDGALIAIRQGPTNTPASATSYYPFTDQVDSVRAMVTTNGTVAASYTYSAYGVLRASTGTLTQPYQYGGGHTDTTTGLIKLGVRYYDPTHGRFTQPDPTGQEAHDYIYVAGDPVSLNDPNGDIPPALLLAAVLLRGASMIAPRAGAATSQAARAAAPLRVPVRSQRAAVQAQRRWTERLEQKGYECQGRGPCGLGDRAHVDYRRPGSQEWRTVHIG